MLREPCTARTAAARSAGAGGGGDSLVHYPARPLIAPLVLARPLPPICLTPHLPNVRRLLESYKQQARRSGVPPHKTVAWVRRKLGGDVAVWRRTVDGVLGRAAPCVFCARELQRFDIRVHCPLDSSGAWFSGRVGDPGAPEPQLSGGQQRMLRHQGWLLCKPPQPPKERPPPPPPKLGTRWQRRKQQQEQQLQQQRQRLQKQQQQLG